MWQQYNFVCSQSLRKLHPNSEYYDRLFSFKRSLLPIIDKYHMKYFLFLDEGDYFLLRVEVNNETAENLKKEFDSLVAQSSDFDDVTITSWSPEKDAKDRILGAGGRAVQMGISFKEIPEGGWKIENFDGTHWIVKPEDLEVETKKFAIFMSKVAGKFTQAYLEEMPGRVDDRWLLSVFIHLLLHSVSEQRFEKATRAFPAI